MIIGNVWQRSVIIIEGKGQLAAGRYFAEQDVCNGPSAFSAGGNTGTTDTAPPVRETMQRKTTTAAASRSSSVTTASSNPFHAAAPSSFFTDIKKSMVKITKFFVSPKKP